MKDFITSKGGDAPSRAVNARSPSRGFRVLVWAGVLVAVAALVVIAALSRKVEESVETATDTPAKRTARTPERKVPKALSKDGALRVSDGGPARKTVTVEGTQAANPRTDKGGSTQSDLAVASTNDALEQPVPEPKKLARTAAEELLLMATPSAPGAMVPPLPDLSGSDLDKSAAQALRTPIETEDGDDTKLLERKMVLAAQKEEFRDLRDGEGWKFKDYVEALRKKAESDSTYLAEATKVVAEAEGDESISDEEFKALKKKVNEALAERGIPALE